MNESDLSEYEKIRLENIKRNAAFLASLHLPEPKAEVEQAAKVIKKENAKKRKIEAENIKCQRRPVVEGSRRSLRLKNNEEAITLDDMAGTHDALVTASTHPAPSCSSSSSRGASNSELWPTESSDLDDFEFEVFAALRKWRLHLSREMKIESYKICQNRTIVELIRRRRNNPTWALSLSSAPFVTNKRTAVKNKELGDAGKPKDTEETEQSIESDLLDCWGIGPSKAAAGGVGYQMIKVIDNDEHLCELLEKSRLVWKNSSELDGAETK